MQNFASPSSARGSSATRRRKAANFFNVEVTAKRLELLRELVPGATCVAVLVNPANPATETTLRDVEPAARAVGLQLQVLKASNSRAIDAAFATFVRERPDALFVGGDSFFVSRRFQLVNLAAFVGRGGASCRRWTRQLAGWHSPAGR